VCLTEREGELDPFGSLEEFHMLPTYFENLVGAKETQERDNVHYLQKSSYHRAAPFMDRRLLVAGSRPFVTLDLPVLRFVVKVVELLEVLGGDGACTLGNLTLVYLEYHHVSKNIRTGRELMLTKKARTNLSVSKAQHVGGNHTCY